MIHVHYSDGDEQIFNTLSEAEEGVSETVFGCNFATTVESICDDNGRNYACNFSLQLTLEAE